ncbi:COP9 signalosome complex subunit 7b-like isoform X1 [Argiope bruennichi]|uniref:COP9 signalosome complex subunit 7b like protein n=1 Tax=Argiope bruennichi TaxID=94029 RepID=A0A8T0ELE8_ARGBR|nr:COP9 signalosome complex subunit 7b-like isoform X1 [Argiope bruennichi]KAF8773526.1 COP9 signalosome complex subunit 7b like protein [Argiope bruennichi]
MSDKNLPTINQQALLEQYLLLAKSAKGAAAVELIKQVLVAPGIYVFGELLDMPNIQELNNSTQYSPYYQLLHLFAFGTFSNYMENKSSFPELTPAMINKLRHLTIVSLATKEKCIPYSKLLKELDMKNLRELEDLIIDVIYADIVRGKLDQRNSRLEVEYTLGRDIKPADIDIILHVLQEWSDSCETVLNNIENQIIKANNMKDNHLKLKQQIETEVSNIKKNLKAQSQDSDSVEEMREVMQNDKPSKKKPNTKGLGYAIAGYSQVS